MAENNNTECDAKIARDYVTKTFAENWVFLRYRRDLGVHFID